MSQRSSVARSSSPEAVVPSPAAATEEAKPGLFERMYLVATGKMPIDHVALCLKASLGTNVTIVIVMSSVAIASHSLALISALVENMVDLFVQGLLWYAGTRSGKKQDYAKYPAGTSRFEPVAIIIAASVMALVSVMFIQESITKLIHGFRDDEPSAPTLTAEAIVISCTAVVVKIGLVFYSRWVLKSMFSVAVDAIQQDNINDTVSNAFAIIAYIVSSVKPSLWYVDPAGAILIFLCIMFAWGKMAREQIQQLVGVCASEEFMDEVKELCSQHHELLTLDIMRAYHFGSNYLVELEVVVPADMSVKEAHDIALQLQFKVEQLSDVERAFVHVDYKTRDYDEHVVSREEDALLVYAGLTAIKAPVAPEQYAAVPTEELHPTENVFFALDVDLPTTPAHLAEPEGTFRELKE